MRHLLSAGCRGWLAGLALGVCPGPLPAQAIPEDYRQEVPSVDWYYASAFGTGRYRAGERTVTVFLLPLSWQVPDSDTRDGSWRLLAPLSLGAVDFGLDGIIEDPIGSVSMAIFTPGVEYLAPQRGPWSVRYFGTFGGGREFDGNDRAWIWSAGVSARRDLGCARWQCTLGLAATWAGFDANTGRRDSMSNLAVGFDGVAPGGLSLGDRELRPGGFAIYRNYLTDLDFIFDPLGIEPLHEEWEAGLSLNASRPFSLFGLRFERVGISYRRSASLRGVHLVGQFPF